MEVIPELKFPILANYCIFELYTLPSTANDLQCLVSVPHHFITCMTRCPEYNTMSPYNFQNVVINFLGSLN
jgi:hypothetical protein